MTDNRTTELLPCPFCGGKATLRMSWMEDGHRYRAVECVECGATTPGNYSDVGDQSAWDWNARTPEQAIAATLGRPKAKSHPYGYERDTGAYDCTRCECGCINDISATYCNDCGGEIEIDESAEKEYYDGYSKHTVFAKKHDDGSLEFCERRYVPEDAATLGSGTLTAEQVREAIERHSVWVIGDNRCFHDGSYEEIADELNAERHVETCEPVETDAITYYDEYGHDAVKVHFMECDRCGGTYEHVNGAYERCPRCGKAVG